MEKNNNTNTFGRWLDLVLAMSGDKEASIAQLAEILGSSKRNVYYVLKELANYGFVVNHAHGKYSLDAASPFFKDLQSSVSFSIDQAVYLYNLLSKVEKESPLAGKLKVKLQRFYHINEYLGKSLQYGSYKNTMLLQRAMRNKRVVILHGYASSNSQTVSDRMVEPFMFLGDDNDIRAYEIKTGINKTFKVTRIGSVEVLDHKWYNETKHKKAFTDMFMFSGDESHHIKLRLDMKAHNLLKEEYPLSESLMTQDDKSHWILDTDVVNYIGIGRFVLGLYENIEVIEDKGLQKYLREKIKAMSES